MRVAPIAAALAGVMLVASIAHAQEAPPKRGAFYGHQIFATAYGGQALVVHGAFIDNRFTLGAGAFSWVFGGAFVHAFHGRVGAAIASPFIEASPMMLAGLAYAGLGRKNDGEEMAVLILVIGGIVAPLVDGLVLGYEKPKREPEVSWSLSPTVTRDRLGLGLGGSF